MNGRRWPHAAGCDCELCKPPGMKWTRKVDEDGEFFTADLMLGGVVAIEIIVSRGDSGKWGFVVNAGSGGRAFKEVENCRSAQDAARKAAAVAVDLGISLLAAAERLAAPLREPGGKLEWEEDT